MRKTIPLLILLLLLACNLPAARPAASAVGADLTPALTQPVSLPTAAPSTAAETPAPAPIAEVPVSVVQIGGAAYQSYQMPGDPFRFVCVQPCSVDPKLVFAVYAGFRNAKTIMVKLMGVDILPEMAPVDMHFQGDQVCGHLGNGPLAFTNYYPPKNPIVCSYLFDYAQGPNGQPYTPDQAVRLDQQTIFVHEYLHLIFIGRFPREVESMHDFVTPLAEYITSNLASDTDPCTYYPERHPGDFGGSLFKNLCAQNGFRPADVAPAMIAVDQLYQSGQGQVPQAGFQHAAVSPAQFRDILNHLLGSDTTRAFADACWPPKFFADSYSLSYACTHPTPSVAPTAVK